MKCPLIDKDCLQGECEWWRRDAKLCAIQTCAHWLENIDMKLDNLNLRVSDLNKTTKNFATATHLGYLLDKAALTIVRK